MEPVILTKNYVAGFCWSDVSARKSYTHLCGDRAGYYRVFRCGGFGRPDSNSVYVWLCSKHVKNLERNGYTVIGCQV